MDTTLPPPIPSNINNFTLAGVIDAEYHIAMNAMGAVSVLLSLHLMYLIKFKTPLASRQYRIGLIVLQLCFLLFDIHWCFLFVPLLTLPYFAMYCTGLLCTTFKVGIHLHMVFMLLLAIETFAWFFICMLQRHQALLPMSSHCLCSPNIFRFFVQDAIEHYTFQALATLSTLFAMIGPVMFISCRLTEQEIQWRLAESPLMRWLLKKPQYLIYSIPMRPILQIVLALLMISVVLFTVACASLMAHTIHIVRRLKLKSGKSKDQSNTAMRNLFIQFLVFACSLLFPAFVFLLRIWVVFDVEIAFVSCQILFASHSLASSLVALLINSNYRRSLVFWKKSKEIKQASTRKITTTTVLTVTSLRSLVAR
uniref:G protein-coupled receptor n=1 Tax=Pristionchus pacificus TaxID=54126 RepID=A0A8R1YVK2_PRIPA